MKYVSLAFLVFISAGCQAPDSGTKTGLADDADLDPSIGLSPTPTPTPTTTPSPTSTPRKPLLSTWTRADGAYKMELGTLTDQDPGAGVVTYERAYIRWLTAPGYVCNAIVAINNGDEDHGTITFVSNRAVPDSTATTVICQPMFNGPYDYAAIGSAGLRLCGINGACWDYQ